MSAAILAVVVSMAGCPAVGAPAAPVPVAGPPAPALTRCDPARLGWAPDGSLWFQVQAGLEPFAPSEFAGAARQLAARG